MKIPGWTLRPIRTIGTETAWAALLLIALINLAITSQIEAYSRLGRAYLCWVTASESIEPFSFLSKMCCLASSHMHRMRTSENDEPRTNQSVVSGILLSNTTLNHEPWLRSPIIKLVRSISARTVPPHDSIGLDPDVTENIALVQQLHGTPPGHMPPCLQDRADAHGLA
jgi:hypothetical protein